MKLPSRPRRCKGQDNQSNKLNNSLKNKKSRKPLSQNTVHEISSLAKPKRKPSQKENDKISNISAVFASTPIKTRLRNTPRCDIASITKQKSKRLCASSSKKHQLDESSLLESSRCDIDNVTTSKRMSKRMNAKTSNEYQLDPISRLGSQRCNINNITTTKKRSNKLNVNNAKKSQLDELSYVESQRCDIENITAAKRRSKRFNANTQNECQLDDLIRVVSKRKIAKSISKTSKHPLVTSTPLKPCHVYLQRCDIGNITAVKRNPKKLNAKTKQHSSKILCLGSPIQDTKSSELSMNLRSRHSTSIKEMHTPEVHAKQSTKKRGRVSKKSKSEQEAQMKFKSFAGYATLDDLALTNCAKRKAKSEGCKLPSRNSLKRKRFIINELNQANDGYEDDIYESQKFDHFKDLLEDSGSDMSFSMTTPKLGFCATPMIRNSNTPIFKDCISPEEYSLCRKLAEEVQYRNKRWKSVSAEADAEKTPAGPEKKRLEFSQVLANLERHEKTIKKIADKDDEASDEDSYFSDC